MKKLSLFVSIAVLFAACSDDDDDVAPVINDTENPVIVEFAPEETMVDAGNEIHMDMQFTDNIALKQAKLEIHDNFDGHSHSRAAAPFEWEMILDLDGQKSYTDHMHVDVPAEATAGDYHLMCIITDEAGNESELIVIDMEITNQGAPVIDLTSPDPKMVLEISPSMMISLAGTVTDDVDLAEIHIMIKHEEGHSHRVGGPIFEAEIDLDGTDDKMFDLASVNSTNPIQLPATLDEMEYELTIEAKDGDGNVSEVHVELEVK